MQFLALTTHTCKHWNPRILLPSQLFPALYFPADSLFDDVALDPLVRDERIGLQKLNLRQSTVPNQDPHYCKSRSLLM